MSTMQETTDDPKVLEDEWAALNGWHRGLTPALDAADFCNQGPRIVAAHWAKAGRPSLSAEAVDAMVAGLPMSAQGKVVETIEQLQDDYRSDQRCREGWEDVTRRRRESGAAAVLADAMRDYPVKATAEQLRDAVGKVIEARGPVVDPRAGDFRSSLADAMSTLADTHDRGWLGLELPSFPQLDGKLCGLRGLMLLGAGPGVGKTQLTIQLGIDALNGASDVGLVYLSLEMSKQELTFRLLAIASGMGYRRLRLGDQGQRPDDHGLRFGDHEREALQRGKAQLDTLGSKIRMFESSDIGLLKAGDGDPSRWYAPLAAMVKAAKGRMGVKRALVVVDNLQAIAVEPPNGKPWASDMDRDRTVIEGLTRLQHDLDDAVLVVSEVSKGNFKAADEQAALLGTGRNAYRADAVMLLKRDEQDADRVDLVVDKGRDGMVRGKVPLRWESDYARLAEVETK
jgi:replicative DNA helicase